MKKNIKLGIASGLFIIGVILILMNFIYMQDENLNPPLEEENKPEISLKLQNLNVDKSFSNQIKLSFDLLNDSSKELEEKEIKLNFYDKDKLLYEYKYTTKTMSSYEMLTVEVTLDFEYQEITKYEFVVDSLKEEIKPIVSLK